MATAALIGLPSPARAATTFYVRVGGLAANDCTSVATPCPTITAALAKPAFAAGDFVDVGTGSFVEHPTIAKAVTITGAGVARPRSVPRPARRQVIDSAPSPSTSR